MIKYNIVIVKINEINDILHYITLRTCTWVMEDQGLSGGFLSCWSYSEQPVFLTYSVVFLLVFCQKEGEKSEISQG